MRSLGMGAAERATDIAAIQEAKRAMDAGRIALNTPPLEKTYSGARTPPNGTKRSSAELDREGFQRPSVKGHSRNGSRSSRQLDPNHLMSALNREFGESSNGNGGRIGSRGTTPTESPSRKRQRVYGDR